MPGTRAQARRPGLGRGPAQLAAPRAITEEASCPRRLRVAPVLTGVALFGLSAAYAIKAVVLPVLVAEAPTVIEDFPAGPAWTGYLVPLTVASVALTVGLAVFGVAMYRAAVLPRWAVALATVGAVLGGIQFLLPRPIAVAAIVVFGLGLAGLGAGLWTRVATPASHAGARWSARLRPHAGARAVTPDDRHRHETGRPDDRT